MGDTYIYMYLHVGVFYCPKTQRKRKKEEKGGVVYGQDEVLVV